VGVEEGGPLCVLSAFKGMYACVLVVLGGRFCGRWVSKLWWALRISGVIGQSENK
jgi:hypothetical protein